MSHPAPDRAATEKRLWHEIENHQIGMLGLVGEDAHQHFQPMTAFVEAAANQIWFFTHRDTDLAEAIREGQRAMFVFQQKELQACVGGRVSVQHDAVRMEKYWNAVIAAWYPHGRADPRLTMLRLECDDAQVWISRAGPVKFAWEIAKANATHHTPDVGERANINFN